MTIQIRRASEADAESVAELLAVLYKGDIGRNLSALVREYLVSGDHAVLVAERQSQVVGLLIGSQRLDIDWECRAALVDAIVVRESARGQGIGRSLMREFCSWARQRGCTVVQVVNPNEGFFGSLGLTDRKARFWQGPIDGIKA
jgi:predicted N-acetyltransferase YhbS